MRKAGRIRGALQSHLGCLSRRRSREKRANCDFQAPGGQTRRPPGTRRRFCQREEGEVLPRSCGFRCPSCLSDVFTIGPHSWGNNWMERSRPDDHDLGLSDSVTLLDALASTRARSNSLARSPTLGSRNISLWSPTVSKISSPSPRRSSQPSLGS